MKESQEEALALKRILDWFLKPLTSVEWSRRKQAIENHLETVLKPFEAFPADVSPASVSITSDRMGWYLYLLEVALTEPTKTEPNQAARVLPIFQRLADDFSLLTQISGVDEKRQRLLTVEANNPDSGMFEILVALLWKRNGWPNVAFVPEAPPEKRPDLEASSKNSRWAIECKRLSKSSEYSVAEREKWLRMWRHLRDMLVEQGRSIVLDIVFHVELTSLPDEFPSEELRRKLPLALPSCLLISNETWEVRVSPVDIPAARRHLSKYYVKCPSDQLNELVAGRRDPNRGFTCVIEGKTVRLGHGPGINQFMDTMRFAAGAFWHCDAKKSIERKARDIRTRLSDAVRQLPDNVPSVVHIGLETLDGVLVEAERYERIFRTVRDFDLSGKDVKWVYCHLYQSYAPPDQAWVLDETVYYFAKTRFKKHRPLEHTGTIVPDIDSSGPRTHWLKDPP